MGRRERDVVTADHERIKKILFKDAAQRHETVVPISHLLCTATHTELNLKTDELISFSFLFFLYHNTGETEVK